MTAALSDHSLDQIFRSARTPNGWAGRPVGGHRVREIYHLMKWGPTSANTSPARFVWVHSADGKATLAGPAAEQNKAKILRARGTIRATNKTFEDDWVFAITVRDGKLTSIREYIDTQALARASQMDACGLG